MLLLKMAMANNLLSESKYLFRFLRIQKHQARRIQTTVDASDVDRHTRHMNEWWDTDGPIKLLHRLNDIRIPFIQEGLAQTSLEDNFSSVLKGKTILDVGCGGGILSEGLAKLGANVIGIDASKELIEVAQYHSSKNKELIYNWPTYINTTIEEHAAIHSEKYDAVVASEIIEHVVEKELFLESCVHATKPNGKLFFTTPSKTRIAQFFVIFINETILNAIPKGTHQYDKFITPMELKSMLEMNNCMVESTRGFVAHPIAKKWAWTNHKLFMFAMQAVKLKRC
ncbi:ubiquinone biosynthesis O-methyltransferase-like [Nymphalis io]|uniref:ubiquinone biosynthesis O-methyltransferase-like n=1 Tax=Inachis io TaxID=171585 RepID=UPI00216705F4|nr:ubiquinone biosynthesis O-methyltransferase-like [Nymphalis io]